MHPRSSPLNPPSTPYRGSIDRCVRGLRDALRAARAEVPSGKDQTLFDWDQHGWMLWVNKESGRRHYRRLPCGSDGGKDHGPRLRG